MIGRSACRSRHWFVPLYNGYTRGKHMAPGKVLPYIEALLSHPERSPGAEEKEAVATVLRRINPREPLGTALFDAITPLSWSIAFEAVWLRRGEITAEVYLRQRSPTDTAYPNEWHCPGSAFRPFEGEAKMNAEEMVAARLARSEFGKEASITNFKLVDTLFNPQEARGSFLSLIYLVEVETATLGKTGRWFRVDELPEVTVYHHRETIIPKALEAWFRTKAGGRF